MKPNLMLIRGLPGSGKSTLATMLFSYRHVETDMYFETFGEGYKFDRSKLKEAHQWCQRETKRHLQSGFNTVVSNTFTQRWEMEPYFQICRDLELQPPQIVVCCGNYKNIHGVPSDVIQKMRDRWENEV